MKNSFHFFIGFSLLVLIAVYGCSGNPEKEIKAAEQAMDEASSYHAEEVAATDWEHAMDAFKEGQAAVKNGKPAKSHFIKARSRFEQTAAIAKSRQDDLAKEVSGLRLSIDERFSKVRAILEKGGVRSSLLKQVNPIVAEAEAGNKSISDLVTQENYLQAREMAKEVQRKIYNAELILAGRRPVP
jgi:hypothetical protein